MAIPSKNDFYQRLRELGNVKGVTNENNNTVSGTLVDFVRSDDGTAYGIVKENHNYFIKKTNVQRNNLDYSDFAYIGGLENKGLYKYNSLSEAEKQRNFYVKSLNEAFSLKPASSIISEEKKTEEKIEKPFDFLKNRISEGKEKQKIDFENRFKASVSQKIEENKSNKSGLLPEQANYAIKKALGKLTESDMVTADSEIVDSDRLDNKSHVEKGQSAALNQEDNQKKADKAMAKGSMPAKPSQKGSIAVNSSDKVLKEGESLATADSQIVANQSMANLTNAAKEKSQSPINDENAKSEAEKRTASSGNMFSAEKSEESEPFEKEEHAGEETGDIVSEEAIITKDSLQTSADKVANSKKVTEKPDAPYNSYNQPDKGHKDGAKRGEELKPKESKKDIVAEEKDLITADSEIDANNSIANKTKAAPKKHGKSEITADSEIDAKKSLANKTKTKLPNPIFESEVLEDEEIDTELDAAANALDDLNISVDDQAPEGGEEAPVAPEMGGGEEMPVAPEGGEEAPVAPEMGGEEAPEMGGGELPPAPEGGEEEAPVAPEMGGGDEMPEDGEGAPEESDMSKELEKLIGKLTQKVRNADLEPEQTQSFMNSIITAFRKELGEVDAEERKKMSDKIVKAKSGVAFDDEEGGEEAPVAPEMDGGEEVPEGGDNEMADVKESECNECGTFEGYMKSRGYDSIEECSGMEMANLISGYANAFKDGMNDGDAKAIVIYLTPEVEAELSSYGHDDYVDMIKKNGGEVSDDQKVDFGSFEPKVPELSDDDAENEELTESEINEFGWSDIKNLGKGVAKAGSFVGDKAGQKIGAAQQKAAGAINQFVSGVENKFNDATAKVKDIGNQVYQNYQKGVANGVIDDIQKLAVELGATVNKLNIAAQKAGEKPIPVQSILQIIANQVKSGKNIDLSGKKFEGEEHEGEEVVETGFAAPQTLGVGIPKMGVAEQKLRKYIRARLEEKAGKRKPLISESQKNETLKKLDKLIDEQWNFYSKNSK